MNEPTQPQTPPKPDSIPPEKLVERRLNISIIVIFIFIFLLFPTLLLIGKRSNDAANMPTYAPTDSKYD